MLRNWVIGAGVVLLAIAVLLWVGGARLAGTIPLVVWGVILVGGIYIERYRYKPELDEPPGPGWIDTNERSIDKRGTVTVWFNPSTGERAYVRAKGSKEDVLF